MCKSGNETIDIHTVSGVWLMVDEGKKILFKVCHAHADSSPFEV